MCTKLGKFSRSVNIDSSAYNPLNVADSLMLHPLIIPDSLMVHPPLIIAGSLMLHPRQGTLWCWYIHVVNKKSRAMVETTMRIAPVILLSKIIFSFCHKLDGLICVGGDIDMLRTKKYESEISNCLQIVVLIK